jgi:hypothetical protein
MLFSIQISLSKNIARIAGRTLMTEYHMAIVECSEITVTAAKSKLTVAFLFP